MLLLNLGGWSFLLELLPQRLKDIVCYDVALAFVVQCRFQQVEYFRSWLILFYYILENPAIRFEKLVVSNFAETKTYVYTYSLMNAVSSIPTVSLITLSSFCLKSVD